jgi:predicted AlkP superfamily pyrophosphatase or phosphodiesterase
MIDGLGADHFSRYQQQLPQLTALAARGTLIERLSPERSATSLPGRTSIVTGVPSEHHGIYGNVIWDGKQFRYANSRDVKARTIAEQANLNGLSVANIGYGMVGPEHCRHYYPPIWAHEMLQSSDDGAYDDSNHVWNTEMAQAKNASWIDGLEQDGCSSELAERDYETQTEYLLSGQLNDQIIIDWCAALVAQQNSPDLILTEIAMPDYFLHRYGCDSDLVQHSIKIADSQVGRLLDHLKLSGTLDKTNIIVTSDHGFSNVKQTIHPDVILPQAQTSCEGGILYLHYKSKEQLLECSTALARYQVLPLENQFLPTNQREQVAAFLAPEDSDFHFDKYQTGQPVGDAHYRANHGFKPGHKADERFLVMAGPDIPVERQSFAQAEQIAPTMAKLLNLPITDYPLPPLI